MPTYRYLCKSCKHRWEKFEPHLAPNSELNCPKCRAGTTYITPFRISDSPTSEESARWSRKQIILLIGGLILLIILVSQMCGPAEPDCWVDTDGYVDCYTEIPENNLDYR